MADREGSPFFFELMLYNIKNKGNFFTLFGINLKNHQA